MDPSLIEFHRKFKQQIDPPNIPLGSVLKNHDVQVVLERRFFNLPASEFSAYQAKVLRTVVERIQQAIGDNGDEEVSDHLMTLLATLPRSRPEVDLSKTLVSYVPPISYDQDVAPIEILEAKKIIGSGPNTGLRTWEAALHLAHHLHSRPGLVNGRRVLELGSGTGFLSIFCAAYLQPESITTTDGHEEVLASLRDNIRRNTHLFTSNSTPVVQKLYWGDTDDLERIKGRTFDDDHRLAEGRSDNRPDDAAKHSPTRTNRPYDIIIGADISYDPDACKALAMTLSDLAKANPYTDILIAATQRNLQTLSGFLDECQGTECGLRVEVINFNAPPFGKQTGLFHNLISPIQIFAMWYVPPEIS